MKAPTASIHDAIAAGHFLALHDEDADPQAIVAAVDWCESSPENQALFDHMGRFWALCDDTGEVARDELLRLKPLPVERRFAALFRPLVGIAASWLLPLLMTMGTIYGVYNFASRPAVTASVAVPYATGRGELRTVRLADGSRIVMGGGTTLTVRLDAGRRHVALLRGEAFFEVAHDTARPFDVTAAGGTTEALGTAFSVRRDSNEVAVTLVHGSVRISADGDARGSRLKLLPGQQASYFPNGSIGDPHKVDVAAALAWREGRLHFVGRSLKSVAEELNRYSPKPIFIDDPVAGRIVITGIVRIDAISDWLQGVASVSDVEVTEQPQAIIIRSKRHASGIART